MTPTTPPINTTTTTMTSLPSSPHSWWSPSSTAHGAILYLALLFLLCHTHCCKTRRRRTRQFSSHFSSFTSILLHNHNVFWLLTLTILVLHVATMAAIWLSNTTPTTTTTMPHLLLITPTLGLLAVGVGGIVHRVIEASSVHPVWLSPLVAYYSTLGVIYLMGDGATIQYNFWEIRAISVLDLLHLCVGVTSLFQGIVLGVTIFRGKPDRKKGKKKKKPDILEDEGGGGGGLDHENDDDAYHDNYYDDSPTVYTHDMSPLLSRLTFFWFTSLLRVGYSTPLEESHLGRLPPRHGTAAQLYRFRAAQKKGISLFWPLLWSVVGSRMCLGGVFRLLADLAGFVAPLGIKTIVSWSGRNRTISSQIDHDEASTSILTLEEFVGNGYVMVGIVLIASLLQATFSQCSTYLVNTEGLHIKVALQGLIYEKCLRVPGRGEETVNLVGEDANNVMMLFWMAHFVWAIPLKLGVLMGLLWLTLGWSALFAAALCILIMVPLQFLIAKMMAANSKKLLERSDERLGWTGEMVASMRLLKTHAWETLFGARLAEIRGRELKHLDNDLLYRSIMTFLTHISTVVVTVVTFGLYPILEEDHLAPAAVFAGLAFFNQLTVPLFIFPLLVPVLIDARVSGRRILEFLSLPEIQFHPTTPSSRHQSNVEDHGLGLPSSQPPPQTPLLTNTIQGSTDSVFVLENIAEDEEEEEHHHHHISSNKAGEQNGLPHSSPSSSGESIITLEDASFSWGDDTTTTTTSSTPALSQITLSVRKERLTVIIGPTGSGKSSLLSALLGELKLIGGTLSWSNNKGGGGDGIIAYAPQSPWILNGSVRENILFGRGFKGRRYKRVLDAVRLQQDLDLFPEGDATEIGDHAGIGLSGGQRQRIGIARAFYSTAPVVILDDPLSALDVEVADHVLNVGICKLLGKRTILLVSHHLPVLHHAHHIVAMDSGRIRIQGSLPEIRAQDPTLASHWEELISKKKAELARYMDAKTAKERWTLLKLVSKFTGFGARRQLTQEDRASSHHAHFRSRKGTFSTYKNLSHDFFLPSDECHHDDLLAPILRRSRHVSRASRDSRGSASSSTRHVPLIRMSSLQATVPTMGSVKGGGSGDKAFNRLKSVPANNEGESLPPPISPRRFRSENNRLQAHSINEPLFNKLFPNKKKQPSSSAGSWELEPPKSPSPLPSPVTPPPHPHRSVQSETELTEDDPQERDDLLGGSLEEREYGSVPLRIYLIYAKACGHFFSSSYLIFAIGYEVVRVLTSFWLSRWSDSVAQENDEAKYDEAMGSFFTGYVLLSIATVGVSLTCNLLGAAAGARSRRILHDNFIFRLIDAPLSFFESTPIGRILGRASADVAVVDRKLVISVQRCLQFVFLCLSAVVVNGVVNPWFLLLALPLVAVYYAIQRFYRVSSRELQRLQAISRGPILSHFHETLQGLSTIRAYGRQAVFTEHMWACIDLNNRADMFINVGNRWLSISLDYLGSIIVAVASLGAVVSADLALVTPSVVGLAINYTLLVPVYLNWVVKFLAEVEMFMNSVDRLNRYSDLETEQFIDSDSSPSTPPSSWPSKGAVDFDKVTISFQDNTVLSELSLEIRGGEKVGLCGRSGSGKSTLLSSLFRLSGRMDGTIRIDGVDITRVPLRKLRSALCIIPQHSVLFTAPLRFNLDPNSTVSDDTLWNALELAQMKETVQALPQKLDQIMTPDSFSAGQRQLIALAVAILHPSRVVVLDEATSSVDADTEQTLLRAVATAFPDSTVLSIAHRLGTIVDGDRVIVLEEGKVVEDGAPSQLLARKTRSIFANMLRAEVSSAGGGGGQSS